MPGEGGEAGWPVFLQRQRKTYGRAPGDDQGIWDAEYDAMEPRERRSSSANSDRAKFPSGDEHLMKRIRSGEWKAHRAHQLPQRFLAWRYYLEHILPDADLVARLVAAQRVPYSVPSFSSLIDMPKAYRAGKSNWVALIRECMTDMQHFSEEPAFRVLLHGGEKGRGIAPLVSKAAFVKALKGYCALVRDTTEVMQDKSMASFSSLLEVADDYYYIVYGPLSLVNELRDGTTCSFFKLGRPTGFSVKGKARSHLRSLPIRLQDNRGFGSRREGYRLGEEIHAWYGLAREGIAETRLLQEECGDED
jgi:hypothetical protein